MKKSLLYLDLHQIYVCIFLFVFSSLTAPTTSAPTTTTQSLIPSSRGSTSSVLYPKTTNQPTAAGYMLLLSQIITPEWKTWVFTPNFTAFLAHVVFTFRRISDTELSLHQLWFNILYLFVSLQTLTTSVPSASTPNNPAATQSSMSSSGSSTPSPVLTKSMRQTTPAGAHHGAAVSNI